MNRRPTEHAYINTLVRGDLSSLTWVESPNRYYRPQQAPTDLCRVHYGALNFRDVMLASGRLSPDAIPGKNVCALIGLDFTSLFR